MKTPLMLLVLSLGLPQSFAQDLGSDLDFATIAPSTSEQISGMVEQLAANGLKTREDFDRFVMILKELVNYKEDSYLVREALKDIYDISNSRQTRLQLQIIEKLLVQNGVDVAGSVNTAGNEEPVTPETKPAPANPETRPAEPDRRLTPTTEPAPLTRPWWLPGGPSRRGTEWHPIPPADNISEGSEPSAPRSPEERPDRQNPSPSSPGRFEPLPPVGPNIPERRWHGPDAPPSRSPVHSPNFPHRLSDGPEGPEKQTPDQPPKEPVREPTRPGQRPLEPYYPTWPGRQYPHLPPAGGHTEIEQADLRVQAAVALISNGLLSNEARPAGFERVQGPGLLSGWRPTEVMGKRIIAGPRRPVRR